MFCDECGGRNREQASYCRRCGRRLANAGNSLSASPTQSMNRPAPLVRSPSPPLASRYDLMQTLGSGGMGIVYEARDPILERPVAIKVLKPALAEDPGSVRRFIREARIGARLRHPNIVSIHEVGESDRGHYYVMDLIDGTTLAEIVERFGALASQDATRILLQIAKAVSYAHDEGVLHRDLKPENVMIDRRGHVVVMDFGLARALDDPRITSDGRLVGSPRYMSPEQVDGHPLDAKCDVFAVGLLYYFLLAGRPLFDGETASLVLEQHRTLSIEPAVERLRLDRDLPELSASLLRRMLERDAARRLPDLRLTVRFPDLQDLP